MPTYRPSQTTSLTPLNPTVGVSGIYIATKRGVTEDFGGKFYAKSPYEDFCWGPILFGQQEFQYKTPWSIKLDKKDSSLFSEKEGTTPKLEKYTDGLLLYNWSDVDSISMDFDEIGLPCMAFERSGVSNIRRLIDGVLFKVQFSGVSPRVMSNNSIQPDTAARDLICFYLDTGILKYRIQRDNFAVAYQPFSGSPLKFDRIYSTYADRENFRYSIYAKGLDGIDYKLDSLNYPASPVFETDSAEIGLSIYSGMVFDVVTEEFVTEEVSSSRIEAFGGISATVNGGYRLILNNIGTVSETSGTRIEAFGGITATPNGGFYRLVLNSLSPFSESGSKIEAFGGFISPSGTTTQIAFPFTYTDSGVISFSIISGELI